MYPKESDSMYNNEVLVTRVKSWNQTRCQSIGEWRKKIWPIPAIEYYPYRGTVRGDGSGSKVLALQT